jgi:hypothetical protein
LKKRTLLVGISRSKQRVHNTGQEHKESNQEIPKLAPLQVFIKPSADENGECYNPHRTIPNQTAGHCQRNDWKRFESSASQTHVLRERSGNNSHRMLNISDQRFEGSAGNQRSKSMPQHMLGDAAGVGVGFELAARFNTVVRFDIAAR